MSPGGDPRVVVVGGGPAGAVAALVLVRRGVPVTVLEAAPEPAAKVGETLPPTLAPLLAHLGLAAELAAPAHLRSQGNRAAWGSPDTRDAPWIARPHGPGWHVDRRRFEAGLAAAAQAAGADWRWGCELTGLARSGDEWRLEVRRSGAGPGSTTAAAEKLGAGFVVDAGGRASRVARRSGARRVRYDRLVGLATLLPAAARSEDTYTLVEAVADGWWYSALLADRRLAVAYFTDGDLLDRRLRAGDPAAWRCRLAEAAATRERAEAHLDRPIGRGAIVLRAEPAETSRLDRIVGEGWLATGDAAAAYDPLSSHGIASAMGSGFYAGHAVADHLAGRSEALPAYVHVLRQTYTACLDLQRGEYAREARWPESPFWRRRHAAGYALEPLPAAGSGIGAESVHGAVPSSAPIAAAAAR